MQARTDRKLIEVRITPPRARGEDRRNVELAGLITALFESGLADLDDVVPHVKGSTVSPAFTPRITKSVPVWTAELSINAPPAEHLEVQMLLCSDEQICGALTATSSRARPELAIAGLLDEVSTVLGRAPFAGTSTAWRRPQSLDPYAELLCGRAAATLYGMLPEPPQDAIGDRRRDPAERAVYVDPEMPVAQWIAGRRRVLLNLPVLAHAAFDRASASRPMKLSLAADAARALVYAGEYEEAVLAWERVKSKNGGDPRFTLGRAQALLAAGQAERAQTELDTLSQDYRDDPVAVALRVSIADALGSSSEREDLLVLWQEVAATDPEPVRRRIAKRIDARQYAEALVLCDELAKRGAEEEASRLAIALAIGEHDYARAERELEALGMYRDLAKLRARAASEQNIEINLPQLAESQDPQAIVFVATNSARRGELVAALALIERALAIEPYMPEALALKYQVLLALGKTDDAARARALMSRADPAMAEPEALFPEARR